MQLPSGIVWRAENDACGRAILRGRYENPERSFVERYLKPGMTVLDIGAHHGFYSLLASRKVGPQGAVIAFEPSPRECKKLARHLALNSCRNVRVEKIALGEIPGQADFFLVDRMETGCNSMRPPQTKHATRKLRVYVERLDGYLQTRKIDRADFVKLDVEGGELGVLEGARQFLEKQPRPPFLCEVQDARTGPWGYRASEIIGFLEGQSFLWFAIQPDGKLQRLATKSQGNWNGNYVAVPLERLDSVRSTGLIED